MIIETITASEFGALCGEGLDLAPGMTVVHGPNESGKSTWHAAIFAALCGVRRTKGRQQSEDREFRERHKPWGSSRWRVSARLRLHDGRHIEMRQDLEGRIDCRATDLDLGRDCSTDIMFEGAPDASMWLGLDRRSFPAIACVRQTEILEVKSQAGALQRHIQRAADTAGVDQTAAAALAKLEEYRATNTGQVRSNSNRPLPSATRAVEAARNALTHARQRHASYLELVANAERLQLQAKAAAERLQLFHAELMRQEAAAAEKHLNRVRELAQMFPDGEPKPRTEDDDLAQQVRAALEAWTHRPTPPTLHGESAEELRWQIERLPSLPNGDRIPENAVAEARTRVSAVDARLAEHAMNMPARSAQASPASLSVAAQEPARPVHKPSRIPFIAGATALLVGMLLLAVGLPAIGLFLMVAGVVAGGVFWARGPKQPAAATNEPVAAPPDDYEERLQQWQSQSAELAQARNSALQVLADALRSRNVVVGGPDRDSVLAAHDLYVRQCEERRSAAAVAARRPDLEARLRDREQAERSAAEANEQLARARTAILAAADRCNLDGATVVEIGTTLRDWLANRNRKLEEDQQRREAWADLRALLDGRTPEQLEGELSELREQAERLSAGLSGAIELEENVQAQRETLERSAADAARAAHEAVGMADERQKSVPDVAGAEEDLARAELELQRLRRLDSILDRTHEFLTRAQERVHRSIAPVLASGLASYLPALTAGRYHEVHVDPETLDVQVAGADGLLRYAHLLSHGTAEQIYLLLRAVLAEHLTVNHEVCPLILDDVTVHCDSQRQQSMLCTLHHLSADRQVVLFTQEDRVLSWAQEQFTTERDRVICLPAPKPLIA